MRAPVVAALVLVLAACPGGKPAPQPPQPERIGEPEQPPRRTSFEIVDNRLILPSPIAFDGALLDEPASADSLAYIRDFLEAKPDITRIRIEGHSDGAADEEDVMFTGERALNVANWLIERGVACERMIVAGFGGSKPIADPSTPEGQARNVRVEVVIAALRDRPIGGMPEDGSAPAAVPACP